jgi:hypothetical protein
MKKIILIIFITFTIPSCAPRSIIMADDDGDGVPAARDACPDGFGSSKTNGCPEYIFYFQRLRPTKSIKLNKYFRIGTSLKECNNKLKDVLEQDLGIVDGEYKYFSINKDSYGIITQKKCIKKDGTLINSQNCTQNTCNMFQFFCVEQGYSRFYLILFTTKTIGTLPSHDINQEELQRLYETDALNSNLNSIPEIKTLLENSKLTDQYSIVLKLFEIKKEGTMGEEAQILPDPTYDFDKQITNIFKPA